MQGLSLLPSVSCPWVPLSLGSPTAPLIQGRIPGLPRSPLLFFRSGSPSPFSAPLCAFIPDAAASNPDGMACSGRGWLGTHRVHVQMLGEN